MRNIEDPRKSTFVTNGDQAREFIKHGDSEIAPRMAVMIVIFCIRLKQRTHGIFQVEDDPIVSSCSAWNILKSCFWKPHGFGKSDVRGQHEAFFPDPVSSA